MFLLPVLINFFASIFQCEKPPPPPLTLPEMRFDLNESFLCLLSLSFKKLQQTISHIGLPRILIYIPVQFCETNVNNSHDKFRQKCKNTILIMTREIQKWDKIFFIRLGWSVLEGKKHSSGCCGLTASGYGARLK